MNIQLSIYLAKDKNDISLGDMYRNSSLAYPLPIKKWEVLLLCLVTVELQSCPSKVLKFLGCHVLLLSSLSSHFSSQSFIFSNLISSLFFHLCPLSIPHSSPPLTLFLPFPSLPFLPLTFWLFVMRFSALLLFVLEIFQASNHYELAPNSLECVRLLKEEFQLTPYTTNPYEALGPLGQQSCKRNLSLILTHDSIALYAFVTIRLMSSLQFLMKPQNYSGFWPILLFVGFSSSHTFERTWVAPFCGLAWLELFMATKSMSCLIKEEAWLIFKKSRLSTFIIKEMSCKNFCTRGFCILAF
uniref:RecQ helicase L2 n=1 Tax=Beta vulgaris TaxID=161934 RepID=I6TMD2_BETVU|nr:RecQ helicase L2 [Beta vulgaris]